ncbi:Uncharacterized protein GBIM_17903 [Gryllus bimaculatus]|nr:Uncharacterized protein GBIM_17903 [Gryllus bimaculatus]
MSESVMFPNLLECYIWSAAILQSGWYGFDLLESSVRATGAGLVGWGARWVDDAPEAPARAELDGEGGEGDAGLSVPAETPSWLSSDSAGSALARDLFRRTERDMIVADIHKRERGGAQEYGRQQRRRLSFNVRRRRTELLSARLAARGGRPLRGRPCYFTEGHVPDAHGRDVNAEASPYWMPRPSEELCYRTVTDQWRREAQEKEMKAPYYEHYNYSTRHNLDLLRRLHIPRDRDDPATMTPGILDIDPDYFSIVEGRPENAATLGRLDIRKYLSDIREVLYTKLMIGYAEDHCMLVEEQYTQELKVIQKIKDQHQKHVKAFEAFLAEDHQKSMEILKQADTMTLRSSHMEGDLKSLNRSLGRLRNEVVILEDKWRAVKNLQRFLYAASPRGWRLMHDVEFMKRVKDGGSSASLEDVDEAMEVKKVRSDLSLTELIKMFHDDVDHQPAPELFFKTPKDLLDVFDSITHLNMDMMLHAEQVRKPLDELFHTLQDARRMVQQDTEKLRTALQEKKETIEWEERRAAGLEADTRRLLDDVFKDAFEIVVGANDNNLSVVEMMREIERAYETFMDDLDRIPHAILTAVEDDVALDERIGFMKAKVAAKQLEHINRLEVRMRQTLLPPPRAGLRPLVFRSPPFVRFVAAHKTECKVDERERALLLHLTEYCPQKDDPSPFLQALRDTGMLQ